MKETPNNGVAKWLQRLWNIFLNALLTFWGKSCLCCARPRSSSIISGPGQSTEHESLINL